MTLDEDNAALRAAVEERLQKSCLPADVPEEWRAKNALFTATPAEPAPPMEAVPVAIRSTLTPEQLDAAWAGVRERQQETIARMAGGCCDGGRCHPATPQAAPAAIAPDVSSEGLREGSQRFIAILREMEQMHLSKTLDYGDDGDALANIRGGADVINVPAWAAAVLRMSDKLQRLRAFFRRGRVEWDGIEDTLLDSACYAVIALVLYREDQQRLPVPAGVSVTDETA